MKLIKFHLEDQLKNYSVDSTMGEIVYHNNKLKSGCRFATTGF